MDENVAIINVTQKQQHIAVQGIGGQRGPQGPKGDAGAGLQISGSVDTYAELPNDLTEADAGKAYFVQADGKLYVWSGVRFPLDGQGSNFVGPEGPAGPSGFSPTASVSKSGTTTTITITDKNGTTTAEVEDGDTLTDGIINGAANNATTVEGSKIALSTVGTPNIRDSAITTDKLADGSVTIGKIATDALNTYILNRTYPIGSIFESTTLATPAAVANALGGTWVAWGTGKFTVGVDSEDTSFDTVEETGGTKTHQHLLPFIYDNLNTPTKWHWNWNANYGTNAATSPNHYSLNGSASGDPMTGVQPKNSSESNLPPYITVYRYKRTA